MINTRTTISIFLLVGISFSLGTVSGYYGARPASTQSVATVDQARASSNPTVEPVYIGDEYAAAQRALRDKPMSEPVQAF